MKPCMVPLAAAAALMLASHAAAEPPVTMSASGSPVQSGPTAPVTADEAVRIAIARSPVLAAARAGLDAAAGRTEQSRAGLLPALSVAAGYTQAETLSGTGSSSSGGSTSTGWQSSATLRQLVFDFDRTRSLVRQSSAAQRAASASVQRTAADLAMQVRVAFYTLVQNQRLVSVQEANLKSSEDHLALARGREASGVGLPVDVSRASAATSAAQLRLTVARNAAEQARVTLAVLMGIDARTPLTTADCGEPSPETERSDALVALAFQRRGEIVAARASLEAASNGERSARVGAAPSLAMTAGVSARGTSFPPNNDTATVGLALQWSPFDAGLTGGRVREARAGIAASRAQLAAVEQSVVADVTQALLNLQSARQRVRAATDGAASADEGLKLAEGRYGAGVGTFIDVTDAQAAAVTARAELVSARAAVDQALASLRRATGDPVR